MNEIVRQVIEEIGKRNCAIVDLNKAIQVSQEGHLILSPVPTKWLIEQIAMVLEQDIELADF